MRAMRIWMAWLAAVPVFADDTHYQNYLVGERALGMGGAFTALADDASGAFYNPAGLALVPTSSLSGSLSLYGFEKQRRTRAYTDNIDGASVSIDQEDAPITTIPTTVGLVRKFGSKFDRGIARHAVGFSTYVPYASQFSANNVLTGPLSAGHYGVSETDKTVWMGPTYAWRMNGRLSVGASVFYSYRSAQQKWSSSKEERSTEDPDLSSNLSVVEQSVMWTSGELFGRIGARFDVSDHFSLGLAASSPSIHLHGAGSLFDLAVFGNDSGVLTYATRQAGGLETENALAGSLRAGVAYQQNRYLGALDVTLQLPVTFEPIDFAPVFDLPEAEQPLVAHWVRVVNRQTVVNVNLGGEVCVRERIPLRAGFFTNFSSAPEIAVDTSAQLANVDMLGVTTSAGYVTDDYEISLGVLYAFGAGQHAAFNVDHYEPEPLRNDFVYFYITGARKALTRLARTAVAAANNPDSPPSKEEAR